MRATPIGSPRLKGFVQKYRRTASDADNERQGTEALAERQKIRPVMSESCGIAGCQHRASYEDIISFDALWDSALRCRINVSWKPSVKQFINNLPLEILRMHERLEDGTWKNGRPHEIDILYPKKRKGLSIRFPDRVYQRSINDNALYPEMTRHFIVGNCACQEGKGTDFALKLVLKYLRRHIINYGTEGWLVQVDIHGYYPNMVHEKVKECFRRYIPWDVEQHIEEVLDQQYVGDVGYNPGSQMVQIAGISLLNQLDHKIKERLRQKSYLRYMDDFWNLCFRKEEAQMVLDYIVLHLKEDYGLEVNEKKTHITPLIEGFRFLGFDFHIDPDGHIWITIDPASVKHERKKIYRLASGVNSGKISEKKADECISAWYAHAAIGNSVRLIRRINGYYINLRRTLVCQNP